MDEAMRRRILRANASGTNPLEIARLLGVSRTTVSAVLYAAAADWWRHIRSVERASDARDRAD